MTSEQEIRELYEECGGDINLVAVRLGLPATAPTPPPYYRRRQPPPPNLGREELRKYIVSARHVDSPVWPLEDEGKLEDARAAYEAGSHEMCQGRDKRGWIIQYLIPRRKRAGARKFFTMEGV